MDMKVTELHKALYALMANYGMNVAKVTVFGGDLIVTMKKEVGCHVVSVMRLTILRDYVPLDHLIRLVAKFAHDAGEGVYSIGLYGTAYEQNAQTEIQMLMAV